MKYSNTLTFGALLGCWIFASTATAAMYSVDANAPVVKLRKSCTESNAILKNCFDTVDSLNTWVNGTRQPNASIPLLVEIGPGTFSDQELVCSASHLTFRGSGQGKTKLNHGVLPANITSLSAGLKGRGCNELSVENLTLEGFWGVLWEGSGSSTWINVTVRGISYGWWDNPCMGQAGGKHYWFGSRIIADPASFGYPTALVKGYGINCGQSWFFGSEILAVGGDAGPKGLYVNHGEAHMYGGALRAVLNPGQTAGSPGLTGMAQEEGAGLFAALAANNGSVHIHGTGIDVIGNALGNDIAALMASSNGEIHANGAAYNLSTGLGGRIHRIINNGGHVHAPYLSTFPPRPSSRSQVLT